MADKVALAFAVVDQFMDDDDDIDEDDEDIVPYFLANFRRVRVPCVKTFYEEVLPDFSAADFSKHFRLTKETFTRLFQEIEPVISKGIRTQGKQPILSEPW